jgi:hypothetical protein
MFEAYLKRANSLAMSFNQATATRYLEDEVFAMRNISLACSAILFLVMSTALLAQGPSSSLEQVLPRVQNHADEFAHHLPDFICHETITSNEVMGAGKAGQKVVVESEFRGRQNKVESGKPFVESREIKTMDGNPCQARPAACGPILLSGRVQLNSGGGFLPGK